MSSFENRLGFNTFVYDKNYDGSFNTVPSSQTIDTNGGLGQEVNESSNKKKSDFTPWWIVIVLGYLYYKEQQGA